VATIAIVVAKSTNVRVRLLSIGGRPESELYSYCGIAGTLCAARDASPPERARAGGQ
jgi:hypothetical protein